MSDFSDKFKQIISALAPTLATALGGPFAGMAVSALAKAIGLSTDAPQKAIEDAVISANPETLAKVKIAELEFQQHVADLGIEEKQLAYADTASARAREIAVKDWTPTLLALGITVGFFGILCYMLVNGKPAGWGGDALLIMLGGLATAWANVVGYYFGSSAGSASKNAVLERLTSK